MLDSAVCRNLRLPKSWPSRVRSSTIQAISLAYFSLTFARTSAANSIIKRIRLQAEVDRLRQEVALLREEIRIKDVRMELVPLLGVRTTRPLSGSPFSNSGPLVAGTPCRLPNASWSRR